MAAPQSIYCDESGFSGNNLLDPAQPYFTYASVAITETHAHSIVDATLAEYHISGTELKARRLLRYNQGRKAITSILENTAGLALVSAWHKRYSLATKFFEHIFEPVLARQNSIFYNAGFHRFISNILYSEAIDSASRAAVALQQFQELMRARDLTAVPGIFPAVGLTQHSSDILADIEAFAVLHHETIAKDIERHTGDEPLYKWLLDVSVSALFALLTTWGQRFDSLVVYCDDSKPLWQTRETFEMMIGRTDKAEVIFEGKRQPIIFNLAEPIHFVSSSSHPGVQVADVFASTLAFCLRQPKEDQSRRWLKLLLPSISDFSVFPDDEAVDLGEAKAVVNRLILRELVDRSLQNHDLFDGMPQFIRLAQSTVARQQRLG